MSRYAARFEELQKRGQKAFIPFTLLGWPDAGTAKRMVSTMIDCGVAALELGFPFSDPVADGPVIQKAAYQALNAGFKIKDGFAQIEEIRGLDEHIPIGILVYYNMVLAYGLDKFFESAARAGVDGVLMADLPIENVDEVGPTAKKNGIDLIFLVSPVTNSQRLQSICANAGGFLYLISRLGVTGTAERDQSRDKLLEKVIKEIKALTDVPICAGFGISTPAHAQELLGLGVDGVITGSRVIEIARGVGLENLERELGAFFQSMQGACTDARPVGR